MISSSDSLHSLSAVGFGCKLPVAPGIHHTFITQSIMSGFHSLCSILWSQSEWLISVVCFSGGSPAGTIRLDPEAIHAEFAGSVGTFPRFLLRLGFLGFLDAQTPSLSGILSTAARIALESRIGDP